MASSTQHQHGIRAMVVGMPVTISATALVVVSRVREIGGRPIQQHGVSKINNVPHIHLNG